MHDHMEPGIRERFASEVDTDEDTILLAAVYLVDDGERKYVTFFTPGTHGEYPIPFDPYNEADWPSLGVSLCTEAQIILNMEENK